MRTSSAGIKIFEANETTVEMEPGEVYIYLSMWEHPNYNAIWWNVCKNREEPGKENGKFRDLDDAILFAETLAGARTCGICRFFHTDSLSHDKIAGLCIGKPFHGSAVSHTDGCIHWKGKE